jgi:hypothetical protein
LFRKPLDFDWICTQEEYETWVKKNSAKVNPTKIYELPEHHKWIVEGSTNCEFEIIAPNTSSALVNNFIDDEWLETPFGWIPPLDFLFTIKDSHKHKKFETPRGCASFYKTAIDWHVMTKLGAKIRDEYKEFHSLRERESNPHKMPKLNVSKNDFFDSDKNGVIQTFVHDDIHVAVAINDRPAYTYYMKDGSEVLTDKNKFFSMPENIRLSGTIEEAMVLAIERSLVPHKDVWTPDFAFKFALAKVCTTITGGYFRRYSFLNLFEALKIYPKNYWGSFQKAVQAGTVRYINENGP